MTTSDQDELIARLGRFPADRYPVQHATTQFHLGSTMLHAGKSSPALAALTAAHEGFSRAGMRVEQAKAAVMLGVALRAAGKLDEACIALSKAGEEMAALDQPTEQAAAAYNLGLVRADQGDPEGAQTVWIQARDLFLVAGYPVQAAAAAREIGTLRLNAGQFQLAIPMLEQAMDLAERSRDERGVGAAANALGLAWLATDEPVAALSSFLRALGAYPRSLRPADHAMVKANLALAHEQVGDVARARLAARQSLALAAAAGPVRAQAQSLLARLPGDDYKDLLVVLDVTAREEWLTAVRDEMARAVDLTEAQRSALVCCFMDGVLDRPGTSYQLVETLFQVMLELPPGPFDLLVVAVVHAQSGRSEQACDRLRAVTMSAMARFPLPQWQRLAASFNAAAEASGQPAGWG